MEEQSNPNSAPAEQTIVYSWQALEFSKPATRNSSWYLLAVIAWLALIGYGIFVHDWLRAGVAALLGLVVWMVVKMKPREYRHELTNAGIKVGEKFYPFSQFRAFGVVNTSGGQQLIVVPAQRLGRGLSLQLGGADVEIVRATLAQYLSEETQEEDLVDRMNRLFRL